jgi:polyhydroxybutyrate depolymerase
MKDNNIVSLNLQQRRRERQPKRLSTCAIVLGSALLFVCSMGLSAKTTLPKAPSTVVPQSEPATSMPPFSRRVESGGHFFHVRSMQPQAEPALSKANNQPVLILLSGPNQNYHADSAWFALLQPVLAQYYQVHAIDRLGNAWSDDNEQLSYRRFADDLALLLPKLTTQPMIIISFASSSISSHLLVQKYQQQLNLKAMIWIDPDVATADAVALYQGYPVDWYQQNLAALLPKLATGVWDQRTAEKLTAERKTLESLVPAQYQHLMDWSYLTAVSQQRLSIPRQQARAREIAAYAADLQLYLQQPLITSLPITVIDSDFETAEVTSDATLQQKLQRWQQQSAQWNQKVATVSGGEYLPTGRSEHLMMLQQPELVLAAIQALTAR